MRGKDPFIKCSLRDSCVLGYKNDKMQRETDLHDLIFNIANKHNEDHDSRVV